MRNAGKARKAGLKLLFSTLIIALLIIGAWSFLAGRMLSAPAVIVAGVWLVFAVFTLSFFRDPDPSASPGDHVILSPAHGTVDFIDEAVEKEFVRGPCRRISIFLSIFDVHVQNAPVSGRVALLKHSPGQFVNAMRTDCGDCNENVLIGMESSELPGERIALRLIAGLLARRIVPWVAQDDMLAKGERTSLIQFGSRVDLYLPLTAKVQVKIGDKVRGGVTVVATRG